MFFGVVAVTPDVIAVVARATGLFLISIHVGKFEGGEHPLVREKPIAPLTIRLVRTVLKKDSNRLGWMAPDQRRIHVAAKHHRMALMRALVADGNITADHADHLAKLIGPLPRHGPSTDRAAARPANHAVLWIIRQAVFLSDLRQNFLNEKPRVVVIQRIVFGCAVVGIAQAKIVGIFFAQISRGNKEADRHGDFHFMDQVFQHLRHAECPPG